MDKITLEFRVLLRVQLRGLPTSFTCAGGLIWPCQKTAETIGRLTQEREALGNLAFPKLEFKQKIRKASVELMLHRDRESW